MATESQVVSAFLNKKNLKAKSTESRDNSLYLFGNKIAWFDNGLYIQDCGWCSATTQDRFSQLGVRVNRKQGEWLISEPGGKNPIVWNGKSLKIK